MGSERGTVQYQSSGTAWSIPLKEFTCSGTAAVLRCRSLYCHQNVCSDKFRTIFSILCGIMLSCRNKMKGAMMIKRSKKPTRKQLETLLSKYFDEHLCESGDIADVESLCIYLGVSRSELRLLEQDVRYGDLIERAKTRIAGMKKQLVYALAQQIALQQGDQKIHHWNKTNHFAKRT